MNILMVKYIQFNIAVIRKISSFRKFPESSVRWLKDRSFSTVKVRLGANEMFK